MAKKYPKLASILKKLLFERDIKSADLARAVELPPPTIHRLVTGKSTRPFKTSLQPIADYFSLEVEQLLGEKPIPELNASKTAPSGTEKIKNIPFIAWNDVNDLDNAIEQSKNKIITVGNLSQKCFALKMNDHSMEPLFPKNTILIFDPLRHPIDRSYVIVKLYDKETPVFRQLLIDLDHKYLKPLNPDLNTDQMRVLTNKDIIIGALFESRIHHESENDFLGD